jgi:hypothetical protein
VRATKGNIEKRAKNSKELKRNMMPSMIRILPYHQSRINYNFKGGRRENYRE